MSDSTSPQFGEPWRLSDSHGLCIGCAGEVLVVDCPTTPREYVQRIVACVNFLAGVPTEDLLAITEKAPHVRESEGFLLRCVAEAVRAGMLPTPMRRI